MNNLSVSQTNQKSKTVRIIERAKQTLAEIEQQNKDIVTVAKEIAKKVSNV